ncbi:MAG TPA: glycosyltransferase family A protein, partial [Anaerolineales bacterium]|nr:glycosyltransferase family A protein [Anaerolineales bacterium]
MQESKKKVSVIIPVFNYGKYLNDAIQSVLKQSYHNFEMIVVDDGSTDTFTQKFLKELDRPEIHVFFRENNGVSRTRNYAVSQASGEYILPLDADDLVGEDFLKDAVTILDEYPSVKVVCGDVEMFGKRRGLKKLPGHSMDMLLGQNTMVVTSLFRKSDFLQTSGFNPNMNEGFEDWDFWLSLLENGGDVYKLNTVALYYRIKKNSRNHSLTDEDMQRLRIQIYQNHKSLYAKNFFNPGNSFEYDLLVNSREYKLGKLLLKPIRFLLKKI